MKKQTLIFSSALLFVVLFYKQNLGLNFSIFAIVLAAFNIVNKPQLLKDKKAVFLLLAVVLSSVSNAWLTSATTFFTVILTSFVFRYYCANAQLKLIPQLFVNVLGWFSALIDVFKIKAWFETNSSKKGEYLIKILAYFVLPVVFIAVFLTIYISSSDTLLRWYNAYEINIDGLIVWMMIAGFYVSFVFWHTNIHPAFEMLSNNLKTDFSESTKMSAVPTFRFLPIEFELRSGIITLFCLNIMLLFYLIVFNIEHLQPAANDFSAYSSRIHSQIYLIIVSIVLAMLVILFYFKGSLNFIFNNKLLVLGAKVWIILNVFLVISAIYQNSAYVFALGLTYKRLGVYMFLMLCVYGLFFTYMKIQYKKKNYYLVDKMSWGFLYALVFCSLGNWGTLITVFNIKLEKPDWYYLQHEIVGNERTLIHYYEENNLPTPTYLVNRVEFFQDETFLSTQLYYKTINLEIQ